MSYTPQIVAELAVSSCHVEVALMYLLASAPPEQTVDKLEEALEHLKQARAALNSLLA